MPSMRELELIQVYPTKLAEAARTAGSINDYHARERPYPPPIQNQLKGKGTMKLSDMSRHPFFVFVFFFVLPPLSHHLTAAPASRHSSATPQPQRRLQTTTTGDRSIRPIPPTPPHPTNTVRANHAAHLPLPGTVHVSPQTNTQTNTTCNFLRGHKKERNKQVTNEMKHEMIVSLREMLEVEGTNLTST